MMGLLALLLAASCLAPASAGPRPAAPARVSFPGSFEFTRPDGWTVDRRERGALLVGPASEGVSARIVVRWVPSGSEVFADGPAYMSRLTRPSSVPLKGWKNGPVEEVATAGRKALRLQRDTTDMPEPGSAPRKEVLLKEEHIAVPASKGFYLLTYSAPRSADATLRPAFRRVVASFSPLK